MKKASKFLVAALLVVSAFMMMGCNLFKNIGAPIDQWQECEIEYTSEGTKVYLTCYSIYSENGKTFTKTGTDVVCPPGLTVCVVPSVKKGDKNSDEAKSWIKEVFKDTLTDSANESYIIHTFGKGELNEDEAEESKLNVNYLAWFAIYNSYEFDSLGSRAPTELTSANYNKLEWDTIKDKIEEKFSIKKLLITYLLKKLEE